jgi:hypothetical protein
MTKPQRGTFIATISNKRGVKLTAIYTSTVAGAHSESRRWMRAQNIDPSRLVVRVREVFKPNE